MTPENKTIVFRLKVSQEEVEQHILRILALDGQINENSEKYFTSMVKQGKNWFMEFVITQTDKDK